MKGQNQSSESAASRHRHALSIDVEDWYHPELVVRSGHITRATPRIEESTGNILSLLKRTQQRATFFLLGEICREHPDLIIRIIEEGHEIACHGMTHRPLWDHTSQSLAKDLQEFNDTISQIVSTVVVKGFRAPTFSLDQSTAWALDVLADYGYQYDSSIFPMKNRLYGVAGAPLGIYRPAVNDLRRENSEGRILEFPATVFALGLLRIPLAGGAYFRLLPKIVFSRALRTVGNSRPTLLYIHPWEFDPETPRLPLGPFPRFVTYFGINRSLDKLDTLLGQLQFSRIDEILGIA